MIAIQIPKITAEIMLPKLWSAPNNNEVINTANTVGTNNFNLFKKIPLNNNSSKIGEIIIVEIKLPIIGT